jgi:hypothetical protein
MNLDLVTTYARLQTHVSSSLLDEKFLNHHLWKKRHDLKKKP